MEDKKLFTNERFQENTGFKEAVETIASSGEGGGSTGSTTIEALETRVAVLEQKIAALSPDPF